MPEQKDILDLLLSIDGWRDILTFKGFKGIEHLSDYSHVQVKKGDLSGGRTELIVGVSVSDFAKERLKNDGPCEEYVKLTILKNILEHVCKKTSLSYVLSGVGDGSFTVLEKENILEMKISLGSSDPEKIIVFIQAVIFEVDSCVMKILLKGTEFMSSFVKKLDDMIKNEMKSIIES